VPGHNIRLGQRAGILRFFVKGCGCPTYKIAAAQAQALARQAKLGASCRVEVPVAEGCNARRRQYKIIRKWQGCEGSAEFSNRGMYEEMHTRTWEAHQLLGKDEV